MEKYIYALSFWFTMQIRKDWLYMGKSLNGKELGKGISQRKEDGLYIARFTNRFGKRQTIYDKTYNGVQKKLAQKIKYKCL